MKIYCPLVNKNYYMYIRPVCPMGSMHGGISGEELGMLDNFRRS